MSTVASNSRFQIDSDPVEAARGLASVIREAAPDFERERRLSPEVVEALRDAGLFHLTVPRDYGGLQADPIAHLRVIEEVAAADGSAGWCLMIAVQGGVFSGFIDPEVAREVWGHGHITAGVARPIGRATPAIDSSDGYAVTGRWPFASGSTHADWFYGECLVYDGDSEQPRKDDTGNDVIVSFVVPRSEVTVHDTWYTTGLCGTASNDFSVESVFVPAASVINFAAGPRHDWAAFRAEPLLFMNHGAHALGIARAAVEEARNVIGAKRGWGGVPLRETGRMQQVIAEATAMYESAHAYFYASAEGLWAELEAGDTGEPISRARARLAGSHAANASVATVDLIHRALATSAIQTSSPLDRQFRDIHTAAAHVMIGPLTYEAAGRVILGAEADFPLF